MLNIIFILKCKSSLGWAISTSSKGVSWRHQIQLYFMTLTTNILHLTPLPTYQLLFSYFLTMLQCFIILPIQTSSTSSLFFSSQQKFKFVFLQLLLTTYCYCQTTTSPIYTTLILLLFFLRVPPDPLLFLF